MSTDKYIQYIEGKTGDFIDFIQRKGKKGYNHITDTKFVDLLDDDFLRGHSPLRCINLVRFTTSKALSSILH